MVYRVSSLSRTALHAFVASSASLCIFSVLHADSTAMVITPASASMVVTLGVTVTTALGTSSDTDVKTVALTGYSSMLLTGNSPQWNAVTLSTLHLDPADASFHFDLFCFPFIGCQSLDVQVMGLTLDTTAPVSSALSASGAASFPNTPFFLQGAYVTTGVAASSGTLANNTPTDFACRVQGNAKQIVTVDQITLAPIVTVVDPASLPSGVTALTITFSSNLANATLNGPWADINPFDLTDDGIVSAADLAVLLGQWGIRGSADFDQSGVVDGADLSSLLANWS